MNITKGLSIENYLTLISIIMVLVGGVFAIIQWKSTIKLRRAEFIDQIINNIRFNKDLADTMYIIEYNKSWYTQKFHNFFDEKNISNNFINNELEYKIDKLFSYIDYICYLFDYKIISTNEFNMFRYDVNRICKSPSSQAYLWNLYHFSKKVAMSDCSYMHIINYGIKYKHFNSNFKENDIDLFEKYVKF